MATKDTKRSERPTAESEELDDAALEALAGGAISPRETVRAQRGSSSTDFAGADAAQQQHLATLATNLKVSAAVSKSIVKKIP